MKKTIFISYNWEDGNYYADELEKELKDKLEVFRDKSSLDVNDDIDDFMRKIADCDVVVLVLTKKYMHSINCMKEASYLVEQPEWKRKVLCLVIDSDLYNDDFQNEIIQYWDDILDKEQKKLFEQKSKRKVQIDKVEALKMICRDVEDLLINVKKKNNPSQIAIVNAIIKCSNRRTQREEATNSRNEKIVLEYLEKNGGIDMASLTEVINLNTPAIKRYVSRLIDSGVLEYETKGRSKIIKIK